MTTGTILLIILLLALLGVLPDFRIAAAGAMDRPGGCSPRSSSWRCCCSGASSDRVPRPSPSRRFEGVGANGSVPSNARGFRLKPAGSAV